MKHEVFLEVKKFDFLEKKVSQTYIVVFSQNHWSLSRKQSCRNFCTRIIRNFARIYDNSKLLEVRLHPQLRHHWTDSATIILEKAYKNQNIQFF